MKRADIDTIVRLVLVELRSRRARRRMTERRLAEILERHAIAREAALAAGGPS